MESREQKSPGIGKPKECGAGHQESEGTYWCVTGGGLALSQRVVH